MTTRVLGGVLAAALLVTTPVAAQSLQQSPRVRQAIKLLEIWLDAQRDYEQIPGLSAAVVHDQDVVWKGAYGFADVSKKTPARPDTIYSICSISKLFTSIAVMQQRDAGKLRLDDPVARHLPWFTIRRTDPHGPEITIEGLLTHSSGLPRESAFLPSVFEPGPDARRRSCRGRGGHTLRGLRAPAHPGPPRTDRHLAGHAERRSAGDRLQRHRT